MESSKNKSHCVFFLFLVLLLVYPLRHVHLGVDLWDTSYNYANFRYNGLEYMDSMWFFATWLANAFGGALCHLPWGDTMLGMNVYTSLAVGCVATGAFWFCVRKLHIPVWLAFLGEILALSLCWAPSAVLYDYLTWGLFLAGTICLYQGLTSEQEKYLLFAGAALGLNVGVRFSNLVQAGLIVAVWYYAFICKKKFSVVMRQTGFCVLGYVGAYGIFLALIAVKYGLVEYVEGILRLFAMTEHAVDYSPMAMLLGMLKTYCDDTGTYWLKRFALMLACGLVCCILLPKKWGQIKRVLIGLITLVLMAWIIKKGFCTRDYTTYDAIYYPCAIFFLLILGLSIMQIVDKKTGKDQKLLALIILLTIYLSSLGSNNAIYSSINNLFLPLPCFLWMAYHFLRDKRHILYFPFKMLLVASVLLLTVQGLQFGVKFTYEEATGARDTSAEIVGIPTLLGMRTSTQKAEQLMALYGYLQENQLGERECILYGNIPGLAYYMDLVPALNIWGGLRSYGPQVLLGDLQKIDAEIEVGGERPIVILEDKCRKYLDTREQEGLFEDETFWQKLQYIEEYMERHGYLLDYVSERYAVYK